MAITTFDTLSFSRRLVDAGVEAKQAEAQAMAMKEAFSEALDTQVATKGDVQNIQLVLKTEIQKIESELKVVKWIGGLIVVVEVIPVLKIFLGL